MSFSISKMKKSRNILTTIVTIVILYLTAAEAIKFDREFVQDEQVYDPRSALVAEIIAGHPSPNRDFFVEIQTTTADGKVLKCGGTIVHKFFVLTAAHCVANATRASIEVGNFAVPESERDHHEAVKFFVHDLYEMKEHNVAQLRRFNTIVIKNDIALVQLDRQVDATRIIPLCERKARFKTLLGTCGLGRVSTTGKEIPDVLMESYFRENLFWRFVRWFPGRTDTLQGRRIFRDNSICYGDSGSPLYVLQGKMRTPQCVYGVTSHYNRVGREECQGRSYFSSVPHFKEWIRNILNDFVQQEQSDFVQPEEPEFVQPEESDFVQPEESDFVQPDFVNT